MQIKIICIENFNPMKMPSKDFRSNFQRAIELYLIERNRLEIEPVIGRWNVADVVRLAAFCSRLNRIRRLEIQVGRKGQQLLRKQQTDFSPESRESCRLLFNGQSEKGTKWPPPSGPSKSEIIRYQISWSSELDENLTFYRVECADFNDQSFILICKLEEFKTGENSLLKIETFNERTRR